MPKRLRGVLAFLFVFPLGIVAFADGFILPISPETLPPGVSPWLSIVYHHVTVRIEEGVAITHVDQAFRNDHEVPIEGTYVFPLPPGAVVQEFLLWMDGAPVEGRVLPADEARELYLAYLREHRDPALLEYVGRDTFQARVFPIQPGETRRIELEYVEVIAPDAGLYRYRYLLDTERFSARPLEEVEIEIELTGARALGGIYSPSHKVTVERPSPASVRVTYTAREVLPDKDFLLYYSYAEDVVGADLLTYRTGEEDGWFLLLVTPARVREETPLPKDLVLVIDRSGSMEGRKIEQAKEAAKFILEHLGEEDRFGVITFNEEVVPLTEGLALVMPARVAAAVAAVAGVYADGWTNIHGALLQAMEWLAPSDRPQYVIFLTDGLPTAGPTDTATIVQDITAANTAGARLFAFGVGYDVDTQLLDLLAQHNRGTTTYVTPDEDLERALSSFYLKIAEPALTDLALEVQGVAVYDLYPRELPDLFYGSQLTLVGRYSGSGPARVVLSGRRGGEREAIVFEREFPKEAAEASFLPRLWASRKIGYLLKVILLEGESEELVNQIIELATRYGIGTPYTSFLVEEDKQWAIPPATATGAAPVMAARSTQKLAEAELAEELATVREVGGRVFLLIDGVWTESTYEEGTETLDIEYLSDAYFQLLSEFPELGPILALGEDVIFQLGGRFVHVGPSGLTELSPGLIAELKGS